MKQFDKVGYPKTVLESLVKTDHLLSCPCVTKHFRCISSKQVTLCLKCLDFSITTSVLIIPIPRILDFFNTPVDHSLVEHSFPINLRYIYRIKQFPFCYISSPELPVCISPVLYQWFPLTEGTQEIVPDSPQPPIRPSTHPCIHPSVHPFSITASLALKVSWVLMSLPVILR